MRSKPVATQSTAPDCIAASRTTIRGDDLACEQDTLAYFVLLALAALDGARDTRFGKRFVRAQMD